MFKKEKTDDYLDGLMKMQTENKMNMLKELRDGKLPKDCSIQNDVYINTTLQNKSHE